MTTKTENGVKDEGRRNLLRIGAAAVIGGAATLALGEISSLFGVSGAQKTQTVTETTTEVSRSTITSTEIITASKQPFLVTDLSYSTTYASASNYRNLGNESSIEAIDEPAELLTVLRNKPGSFTFGGNDSDALLYNLTPYKFISDPSASKTAATAIRLNYEGQGNWISLTNRLTVKVSGYRSPDAQTLTAESILFTGTNSYEQFENPLYNIQSIILSRALPGKIKIAVGTGEVAPANTIAYLSDLGTPVLLYTTPGTPITSVYKADPLQAKYLPMDGDPVLVNLVRTEASSADAGVQSWFKLQVGDYFIGIDNKPPGLGATPTFIIGQY